jgi:ketosteroid isomerase-like protein
MKRGLTNEERLNKVKTFYDAFSAKDGVAMASFYHPDARFEDPAFGPLNGMEVQAMWKMLCENGKDLEVRAETPKISGVFIHTQWEAKYTFSKTGRKVHNLVESTIVLKEGLIYRHSDDFNLRAWAIQALGMKGWLLGGTGFFKRKLQSTTRSMLASYMQK